MTPLREESIPALAAPPIARDNPFTRSTAGIIGMSFLALMILACIATLPWTAGKVRTGSAEVESQTRLFNAGDPAAGRLPPWWWSPRDGETIQRLNALVDPETLARIAAEHQLRPEAAVEQISGPAAAELRRHWPTRQQKLYYLLGTDLLGRSLTVRALAGGGISLGIGIAAALLAVCIGTLYGSLSAYAGGAVDGVMMRIVDILYGLPYILLVVLLAVASDAALEEYISRSHARASWVQREAVQHARAAGQPTSWEGITQYLRDNPELREELEGKSREELPPRRIGEGRRMVFDVVILFVAIAGVSWLTMARVIRGQVLSLKNQPFMEAARAMGVPWWAIFRRHLLPNILGPVIVYATLTVPVAILQESFLSFLGIGVKAPLPSWGNLAADGLKELNTYKSYWWLLVFPCLLLGTTLLALNFVGEGLREALDPKRARR
jgi:oligopeptide transport system permease protein